VIHRLGACQPYSRGKFISEPAHHCGVLPPFVIDEFGRSPYLTQKPHGLTIGPQYPDSTVGIRSSHSALCFATSPIRSRSPSRSAISIDESTIAASASIHRTTSKRESNVCISGIFAHAAGLSGGGPPSEGRARSRGDSHTYGRFCLTLVVTRHVAPSRSYKGLSVADARHVTIMPDWAARLSGVVDLRLRGV
jgi:hypothetical protein